MVRAGHPAIEPRDLYIEFLNSVLMACGIPETGAAAGSPECVAAHYNRKRAEWIARLSGPAREEANRAIEQHVALQADLQRLGLLPPAARIDGVYGPATRSAISGWQTARGRPNTSVMSDADAAGFEPTLTGGVAPVSQPASVTAAAPRPFSSAAPSQADEVRLKERGGTYRVPVRINDAITLDFTLDSGASEVLIPADVLMTLIRTETLSKNDFLGERTYVLADGSKLPSERINLRELQVGGHRLTNVTAGVAPATSDPLLGQSFLSRFKSWTFDNDRHVLVLSMSPRPPAAAPAAPSDHSPTAQGPNEPGTFERFPVVAAYRDAPAMPDFDGRDREFKNYRTRIRNGIAEGSDFAGRYKVIQFGCGTGCSFVLLADVSTGRVYSFPHGGENEQMLRLEYRITSNLIRASWVPNIQDMNTCAQEDLLWDNGRFTSLRTSGAAPCPN
jgi:clan AA aspartic protease (TIGR02281 family)